MADSDKTRSGRSAAKKPSSSPPRTMPRKPEMSESESTPGSVFDTERISRLVELMKAHDLSEIDLRESRQRIRICRGPQDAPRPGYAAASTAAPPSSPAPSAEARAAATPPGEAANIVVVKSPMVGTFYSRPNPKAEAY